MLNWLHRLEDGLLAVLALALVGIAGAQIALRFFADSGFSWADSLMRTLVLWLAMLGALAASRQNKHLGMDALTHNWPQLGKQLARTCAFLFAAVICVWCAYLAFDLVKLEWTSPSEGGGALPGWVVLLILPVAFAGMAMRFAVHTTKVWIAPVQELAQTDSSIP